MTDPIDFYFDFSSPYAYFAAQKIEEVAMEYGGREVEWHPIMLGVVMKSTQNQPLAHQPLKGEYAVMDWARMARYQNMPWKLPEKFPIASLAPSRAFYWIADQDKIQAKNFAKACFHAYFAEGRDITDVDTVAAIGAAVGCNADDLRQAVADNAIKERLKDETWAAVQAGVIGSPFFIVDGEKFWGSDRIWMIKYWLKRGGW
ncbi:MAG: 2-hydroxychromene-2-carboxylate isomerase [Rhodospirillales bacterium]|nr:2-hydroxychromene-2-carboxylate isomerase [Rhodospirillales bacterium]